MNKVFVTGVSGFVGSAVAKELARQGSFVIGADIAENANTSALLQFKNFMFIKLDIFDTKAVKNVLLKNAINTFFHFAWIGSAGPLREDADCQINNAKMTLELLQTADDCRVKRFVCAGSIMEFESLEAIYAQGNHPQPSYMYGIGKQLAHSLCKLAAQKMKIELIWTYITNCYGVGELSPRLINSTIRKCIHGDPLQFTSGTQHYDFIYVDDAAKAFRLIGETGRAGKAYLIGSGKPTNLRFFLETAICVCGKNNKAVFGDVPFTGIDLPLALFSTEDLEKDCQFKPDISFEEGIKRTYEWLLLQERGN